MTDIKNPDWVPVGRVEDFPENRGRRVQVKNTAVALFHVDGRFYALRDRCTHAAAPLSRGTVKGRSVMCPRHGAHFDLETGSILTLQAVRNVEIFSVKVREGEVLVGSKGRVADPLWMMGRRLDEGAPDPEDCLPMLEVCCGANERQGLPGCCQDSAYGE